MLNTIERKVSEIKPYKGNAKKHSTTQIKNVAESIRQFGFRQPIVLDKDDVIIIGHCRYEAAKLLNMETVPCNIAAELSEEQVRKLRNLDNKLNESEWDLEMLSLDIEGLDFKGFDIDWGLPSISEKISCIEGEVPTVDEQNEPTTKLGDIWKLGDHRLICGDSTREQTLEHLMNGNIADIVVTDPPYNVDYEGGTPEALKIQNDSLSDADFFEFLTKAFNNLNKNLKKGGAFYIWHAESEGYNVRKACKAASLHVRQCLIWNKSSMVLGRQDYQWKHEPCLYGWKDGDAHYWCGDRTQTTVLDYAKPFRNESHPTMKPVELYSRLIENSSRNGEIVLDLFAGSGTVVVACEQNGRKAYMSEIDPRYCDVIIQRWELLTGKKAERITCIE